MYAARKGTLIEAILYVGEYDDRYPYWVHEEILYPGIPTKQGNLLIRISDETDDEIAFETLIPYRTIILRNKWGDLYFMGIQKFKKLFHHMGKNVAALKSDCIEYYEIFKDTSFRAEPMWVQDCIYDEQIVFEYNQYTFYDYTDGAIPMSPHCILLRNKVGDVKYIEPMHFDLSFDRPSTVYSYERE